MVLVTKKEWKRGIGMNLEIVQSNISTTARFYTRHALYSNVTRMHDYEEATASWSSVRFLACTLTSSNVERT